MGIFDSSNMEMARNPKLDWQKREEALDNIKGQKLLAQLTRDTAVGSHVRLEACKRLDDPGLWEQLATDDPDAQVRLAACKRLDDQRLWAHLAKDSAARPDMRLAACERLDDPGLWGQLARDTAAGARVRFAACERLDDPGLWGQLARDTDEDLWVRIEAFSKAFDQLVCDQELCCKVVHDCIAEIKKHERHSTGKEINILVRIAAHVPGTIRQFWAQIESACHDDCPNSRHWDVSSVGDNCSHGDDYGAAPHHRDRLDSHWLRRFPAAARR